MVINIAVIGSSKLVEKLLTYQNDASLDITPFIYHKPEESILFIKEIQNDYDVVLFTGPVPYRISKDELKKYNVPSLVIPFDEYMLSISLFKASKLLNNNSLDHVSIDFPNSTFIDKVLRDLDISEENIYIKEYQDIENSSKKFETNNYVKFHEQLWKDNKIKLALTSITAVNDELIKMGIPCLKIEIPERNIVDSINKSKRLGELTVSSKMHLVVGCVEIDDFESIKSQQGDYYAEARVLELQQALLKISNIVNATIQQTGKDQFIIFGNRGNLEHLTNQYKDINIIEELIHPLDIKVNFGFGLGYTAKQAEKNAKLALTYSKTTGNGNAYIFTEKKEVIGPLIGSQTKVFSIGSNQENLKKVADDTGLSIMNISKVKEFSKIINNSGLSAVELSEYMEVSRRTAERVLNQLLKSDYVTVIGKEQPNIKGRPRTIYKVNY